MKKKKTTKINLDLIPGMLLLLVFPLIAHEKITETYLSDYAWYPNQATQSDLFLYAKSMCFLALAVWMMLVIFDKLMVRRNVQIVWKKWIPLGGYLCLVIVSTMLSKTKVFALHGMVEQYETVWVLIGYGIEVLYFTIVLSDEKDCKVIKQALLFGAFLQCLIGVFQLAGMDFWCSSVGKWLLTGNTKAELVFSYAGSSGHRVYMTFAHPNYAGVYFAMMLPIAVAEIVQEKQKAMKAFGAVLSILLVICLWGTGSRAGMIAVVVEVLGAIVLFGVYRHRSASAAIAVGIVAACLVGVVIHQSSMTQQKTDSEMVLSNVVPGTNSISFQYKGTEYELTAQNAEQLTRNLKKLKCEAYTTNGISYLNLYYRKMPLFFAKTADMEKYQYLTIFGKEAELGTAKSVGFSGMETLFSNRGYIWSRTIPLLVKTILVGTGPDTFAVNFPQNDTVARMNVGKSLYYSIITKAHNMYLQTGVQTGVLSLIFLLWFWIAGVKNAIFNREKFGYVLAIIGYLVMGLANDSVVAVAPIAWGILGMLYVSKE